MTDKVQKIREEVEKLKSNLIYGACSSQIAMETRCKEEAYNEVLAILDTMQEEPKQCMYSKDNYTEEDRKVLCEGCEEKCKENDNSLTQESVSEELEEAANNALNNVLNAHEIVNVRSCLEMFKYGAKWQREKDQFTIELAEDHAIFAGMEKMKEEMMEKAIDAELYSDGMLTPLIGVNDKEVVKDIKFGDKIKLIIIKDKKDI